MELQTGDHVERRYGRDDTRFGRITGRVREGYDVFYVTCENLLTYLDNARDLRPASPPAV